MSLAAYVYLHGCSHSGTSLESIVYRSLKDTGFVCLSLMGLSLLLYIEVGPLWKLAHKFQNPLILTLQISTHYVET